MFCCLVRDAASADAPGVLEAVARSCSPRVRVHGAAATAVMFDASGLSRVLGPADVIAREVHRLVAAQGLEGRVAIAGTATAAWLLAHARPGITVAAAGDERAALAPVPAGWLATLLDLDAAADPGHPESPAAAVARRRQTEAYQQRLATFERWGLRRLGDIAGLPRAEIHARMGPQGVRLHQGACGEDAQPFAPAAEFHTFVERLDLEWPIEGLEPLSFVLGRPCDRLSSRLEQADRGAVAIRTRLHLVTREIHTRDLTLPAPMREARVLRTLILLDLESHPPSAGIDRIEVEVDVTPGRIVQGSLFARSLPAPEQLATLLARLRALVGESRVGAPALVDSYDARAVAMRNRVSSAQAEETRFPKPAATAEARPGNRVSSATAEARPGNRVSSTHEEETRFLKYAVRRFRLPVAARVEAGESAPVQVWPSGRALPGGRVVKRAGPWRSSGQWWTADEGWDRDLWDVEVAGGSVYRLARDRRTGQWAIEAVLD